MPNIWWRLSYIEIKYILLDQEKLPRFWYQYFFQMGGLECVITGLMDEFSSYFREKKYAREIFTLGIIVMSFSVALINVTPVSSLADYLFDVLILRYFKGGIYMFHLFDTYSAGISLLCSALFEAVAVSWFYGKDNIRLFCSYEFNRYGNDNFVIQNISKR